MTQIFKNLYEFIVFLQAVSSAYILVRADSMIAQGISVLSFIVLTKSLVDHYMR